MDKKILKININLKNYTELLFVKNIILIVFKYLQKNIKNKHINDII